MYYVFAGDTYYPKGGALDLVGFHETLSEAVACAAKQLAGHDWAHVCKVDDVRGPVLEWSSVK